jgi:hypothetical protein
MPHFRKYRPLGMLALTFYLLIAADSGFAGILEHTIYGTIDWSRGVVTAKGIGLPGKKGSVHTSDPANQRFEAAKADAVQNLFRTLTTVKIYENQVVGDVIWKDEVILKNVKEMIADAQVIKQIFLSDGTVEITVQMKLYSGFSQLILPESIQQVTTIKPVVKHSLFNANSAKKSAGPSPKKPGHKIYSGLIVDARGTDARPIMVPRLLDENQTVVYGPAFVSREFAVQHGVCGYTRDLSSALVNTRVANNPLIIKGIKASGPGNADIILRKTDIDILRSAPEHLSFLKKCRVVLILDALPHPNQ